MGYFFLPLSAPVTPCVDIRKAYDSLTKAVKHIHIEIDDVLSALYLPLSVTLSYFRRQGSVPILLYCSFP